MLSSFRRRPARAFDSVGSLALASPEKGGEGSPCSATPPRPAGAGAAARLAPASPSTSAPVSPSIVRKESVTVIDYMGRAQGRFPKRNR